MLGYHYSGLDLDAMNGVINRCKLDLNKDNERLPPEKPDKGLKKGRM